uniref:Beta-glucuronosyltransferase GlcAT14A-like n=1 Tax=Nicotiana tabacum TaxID=4097 RepID=A0A1S4DH72_TOBAC|nr:PREDICTED: beta-glucuronosyltransferase GlcAT14A-like [Nicotiana tabacum]
MPPGSLNMEKKTCANPLVIILLVCFFLLGTSFNISLIFPFYTINSIFSTFLACVMTNNQASSYFVEAKIKQLAPSPPVNPSIPRFAYLISGSKGDLEKLWRSLRALYHPWNYYVVHLDLESHVQERLELALRVEKDPIFSHVGNVHMITKANMVTYRGPTMVANTLHACAILLEKHKDWDWFINLSASDYPLVTQDDLLYTFSDLKGELNFIEHTSELGWKEDGRAMPIVIDPGLYKTTKSDIFWVTPTRSVPTAFKLFTG